MLVYEHNIYFVFEGRAPEEVKNNTITHKFSDTTCHQYYHVNRDMHNNYRDIALIKLIVTYIERDLVIITKISLDKLVYLCIH